MSVGLQLKMVLDSLTIISSIKWLIFFSIKFNPEPKVLDLDCLLLTI